LVAHNTITIYKYSSHQR